MGRQFLVKQQIVVIVDNLLVDFSELFKMIDEAEKNNLQITFITAIRPSDWKNYFGNFKKSRLQPVVYRQSLMHHQYSH